MHDTTKLLAIATTLEKQAPQDPQNIALNKLMGDLAIEKYNSDKGALHAKYASYCALYYNNLGAFFAARRDAPNTLAAIDKSISLFNQAKMPDEANFALISKATFLSRINEYEQAIAIVFKALQHFEKDRENNADEIAYAQATLARMYSDFGKYDKSIEYNTKIISFYESKKSPDVNGFYTLGTAYLNSGSSFTELKKYGDAVTNLEKGLKVFVKIGDVNNQSVAYAKLANVKIRQAKFDEAEALMKKSLENEIGPIYSANANVKFGLLYFKKKDFIKADLYLTKGLRLSEENGALELQEQASDLLYQTNRELGNFKKAFEMYELHDKLVDASKIEESKNQLAQQQLKYDYEKKELNYKLASEKENAAKNNLLTGLSGVLLLLVLGGFFYYRNSRQKQKIAVLEKNQIRQKLLLSQMNPHFIFNSIQNIRSLIRDKKDEAAVNYLNRFSKLTRQILENSDENYISLSEEIEMINNYLAIQQLLYSNSFEFSVDVAEEIETEAIFLPPMLTQPFIENAIKHGLSGMKTGGKIAVKFYQKEGKLFFEVTDNGRGFDASEKNENHKSMAMAITRERLGNHSG
ncbi:histidine kinase, partial [Flavobacterium sp.]|uniref:histidine kinase n=1 Tax=Flavobacterium sp. TaxID=239 RepID=UPI0025C33466